MADEVYGKKTSGHGVECGCDDINILAIPIGMQELVGISNGNMYRCFRIISRHEG